jgi:hypothetical protein
LSEFQLAKENYNEIIKRIENSINERKRMNDKAEYVKLSTPEKFRKFETDLHGIKGDYAQQIEYLK